MFSDQFADQPLKALIITMGGTRRETLETLIAVHNTTNSVKIQATFVPGVPSRALRSRNSFAYYCNQAGLLPESEWEAVRDGSKSWEEALAAVAPPQPGAQHYLLELWQKGKALNRGRAVLACSLAHLIALKQFTDDGTFDVLLEDNVRWNPDNFTRKVRDIQRARNNFELERGVKVHMQYFGWLGSAPNLRWTYASHIPKRSYNNSIVPFPDPGDISDDLKSGLYYCGLPSSCHDSDDSRDPGGNPVWGCYGYWISPEAYTSVMSTLRTDVGSMLWKGKRQRCYQVKPVDKFLPRLIRRFYGNSSVQLCVKPAFFRAPMLTSKIHTQYDPSFCKSTTLQLALSSGEEWSTIALSETERKVVGYWRDFGIWITPSQLETNEASSSMEK